MISAAAEQKNCPHARDPQQKYFCPACKIVLCQECKLAHVSAATEHHPALLTDMLCDVLAFYTQTGTKELQMDSKLAEGIRKKISRARLFAQGLKEHLQMVIDGIVGEQIEALEELSRSAEKFVERAKSVDKEKVVNELVTGFAQKDYTKLIDKYQQLPELQADAEKFEVTRETVRKKIEQVSIPAYSTVQEDIEKKTLLLFKSINLTSAPAASADPGLLSSCVICKDLTYVCANCKQQCGQCGRRNFCKRCAYQCGTCNALHCLSCVPAAYHCPRCKKNVCEKSGLHCTCGYDRLAVANTDELYTFDLPTQFSFSNTSHWFPDKMLDPTVPNTFAFDDGRIGWVCWNMTGKMKRLKRLVYAANSGNTVAVEYSTDGTNFTEAGRFVDSKPVTEVKLEVEGTFPFWRIRIIASANRSPYHSAMWYY